MRRLSGNRMGEWRRAAGKNLAVLLELVAPAAFCELLSQEFFQPIWSMLS